MSRNYFCQSTLLFAATFFLSTTLSAKEYTLAIHPVLPAKETRGIYQPLADYLSQKTGHQITLVTNSNFLTHWQTIKRGAYDLVLDGPQFTGYRLEKLDYTVLAKFPSVVSYTLVANEDEMIMDPAELIGKKVATTPSPALGALRLDQLYPNPLRQPIIVETNDSEAAAQAVIQGKSHAAMIPAAMVGNYPQLLTVTNTEQIPAPALSASPGVEESVQAAIREALLKAGDNEEGKAVLEQIRIERFVASDGSEYRPHAALLQNMWAY
ncbi:MAG: phosphate/phosphite/phosphonate ABC transporter substrate-binding protein [Gammaproteobacteria bacterium]|nr:phosphate/phosphite/phosphonate ABC transporter substrate-binding protein [Gammaproteobacteria bacterium]